jgi:LmbE family N-acetylglucosaminyl deacetylase
MLYDQKNVANLGSILGIWAHPDDESWSSAGLMKLAKLNGQKVGLVTATNGEAGESADENKWPKERLGEIRKKELENCLCYIGDVEQFWLGYKDGKMVNTNAQSAVDEIVSIIKVFKPDTVITFEPNGITGHEDHKLISMWSNLAVEQSGMCIQILHAVESREKYEQTGRDLDGEFNIFFNIKEPVLVAERDADVLVKLEGKILECKMCCLKAHSSQTSQMLSDASGREALKLFASTECFLKANK